MTISPVFFDKRGKSEPYCFTTAHRTTEGWVITYHRFCTESEAEIERSGLISWGYTPATERDFATA
jgi:hypothetical protein